MTRLIKILCFSIAVIVSLSTLCSCDNDDSSSTEYTVNYNVSDVKGVIVDVLIYEVDSNGQEVASYTMSNVKHGMSKKFVASDEAKEVLITFRWTIGTLKPINHLVVEKFIIKKGKNISINLNDETKII